jgi:putative DNA primase/helicase
MAELFKGYILSNGKEPLKSVKDPANWLKEPPTDHDYVGILYDDIIQLDFDDEQSAKIAMNVVSEYKLKCDILKTTRGVHLYFKNDVVKSQSVGVYNAIGLHCDVGLGSKSRVIPLRVTKVVEEPRVINGEEIISRTRQTTQREWLQTYPEVEVLPAFFRPISPRDYELKRSDTRNQTLFNYILTLQSFGFNKDEVRKTVKIINKYILYEPLSDREIDTITRDEAFSEELFFGEKGKFLQDRFGNYMLANSNILKIDNQIHIYTKNSLYSNDPMEFEKVMLQKIPSLKDSQRKEVYKYIELKCEKVGTFANPRYIGLRSTILDIQTMEQQPYSPQWIINNRIDFDYDPSAYSEVMDKTLDKVCCNDPQIRSLLEEMIGYTLYRKNTMQVCFILTGEGSNGKSTILNCIKHLVGKKNYTSLDLRELEDTFKPAELYNKLANIGDDISAKFLESSSVFKKCVTGESFMVQKKYAQPFELESYATQIFCANELPQVKDKSDGFGRRIVIVPFNARFSKSDVDYDPFIEDKLMDDEAIMYLLKLAIEGLQRVLYGKSFTKSDKGESEKSDYMVSNNNVLEWIEEDPIVENNSVNDVYMAYQVWCAKNGCQAVKKLNFSKEIKKQLGLGSEPKNIDGKTVRVYVKES